MADLTDVQWELIRPLIEFEQQRRADQRDRPWRARRQVMNGVLWILCTGHLGTIFRRDMVRTRLAIGGSSSGSVRECWMAFCGRWPKICWRGAS